MAMYHVQNLYQIGPQRLSEKIGSEVRPRQSSPDFDHVNCQIYLDQCKFDKSKRHLLGSAVHTSKRHMREAVINLMDEVESLDPGCSALDDTIKLINSRRSSPKEPSAVRGPQIRKKITINVSGRKFLIYRRYLERYPATLLGSCDLDEHYDPYYGDYFFDTNPEAFESIFDFYLYGKLYQPATIPNDMFKDSLRFFRMTSIFQEMMTQNEQKGKVHVAVRAKSTLERLRKQINNAFQNPKSSFLYLGLIYGWVDIVCIVSSIVIMLCETEPKMARILQDKSLPFSRFWYSLELAIVIFFTFDVLLRFSVTYKKIEFLKNPSTWLDILTVGPYFLELCVKEKHLEYLRVLKVARIARVLKLIKTNRRLKFMATVLSKSCSEMSTLLVVWAMCITFAGCCFYFLEENSTTNGEIKSAFHGLWLAVVTMSTVGYGDIVPISTQGKLFGTAFVYVSTIFIALPLTIIVGAFSRQYELKSYSALKRYRPDTDSDNNNVQRPRKSVIS